MCRFFFPRVEIRYRSTLVDISFCAHARVPIYNLRNRLVENEPPQLSVSLSGIRVAQLLES